MGQKNTIFLHNFMCALFHLAFIVAGPVSRYNLSPIRLWVFNKVSNHLTETNEKNSWHPKINKMTQLMTGKKKQQNNNNEPNCQRWKNIEFFMQVILIQKGICDISYLLF